MVHFNHEQTYTIMSECAVGACVSIHIGDESSFTELWEVCRGGTSRYSCRSRVHRQHCHSQPQKVSTCQDRRTLGTKHPVGIGRGDEQRRCTKS